MDVPTLMHNLREEVSCSVCIQLYKEPKQLPCLHIFCLECLNDLARMNARHGKIKCPLCQIEVAVPDSGTMEALPGCFYLNNLLDILAIKECNTSKVTCGNCEKKSDEASYCFHCCKFWCKECLNGHNILKENKEHRVLGLKDFQDKDFEDVLKRPAFCPKELHEKGVFKFYCKVCQVPACQTCVTLEHGKHDVEHLEITTRATKNRIASELETAKKSSNRISKNIQELEKQFHINERQSQIAKEKIQQTVESLILTLRQKEQELVTTVENQKKEVQERLTKHKGELQGRLHKREETISQIERLTERSSGAELVGTRSFMGELFEQLRESADSRPFTFEKKISPTVFIENREISKFFQEENLGLLVATPTDANQCTVRDVCEATVGLETQFELTTETSEGRQCYCPGDCIAVEIVSVQGGKAAAGTRIFDQKNGNYDVFFIPRDTGQHEVTVKINGEELVFRTDQVKERSFKPVCFLGEHTPINNMWLNSPWDVVANNLNDIFVTDMRNDRILRLPNEGDIFESFGEHMVDKPTGLSIDHEGKIYIANRGNNKIVCFDPLNGVNVIADGESLKEPRGISLDPRGNLIVCDTGNKCVKIISPEGNIIKTVGQGTLLNPKHCLCYENKIFVSDQDAHRIKVYKSEGDFLYEFGRHGTGDGELNEPSGLAVDKTGHLLVCSAGNHRVQVFTLDGKFVTKFGELGEDPGQIRSPTSVAVLENGLIVVCEFGNCRLQLFA